MLYKRVNNDISYQYYGRLQRPTDAGEKNHPFRQVLLRPGPVPVRHTRLHAKDLVLEIRLPEALEEKLLCPFHYFGVADPMDISGDQFWRNGRYDDRALENIYTGNHLLAMKRVDTILTTLDRYEPSRETIKGIGFCVTMFLQQLGRGPCHAPEKECLTV